MRWPLVVAGLACFLLAVAQLLDRVAYTHGSLVVVRAGILAHDAGAAGLAMLGVAAIVAAARL
jgi:hypothetical protein